MTQQPPPPGFTPGGYPNYQPPPPPAGASTGLAIASLVLGILSVPCFCFTWFDLPLAIVAIILGVLALNKVKTGQGGGKGMATAGLILGSIGLILALVLIIVGFVAGPAIQQRLLHFQQQVQQQQQQIQQQQGTSTTAPSTEP
jgi:hypothetical protein